MATLAPQNVTKLGTAITYAAASAGGDKVLNPAGNARLHVKNGGGSTVTVTIAAQEKCSQGALHDLVVTVAAGAEKEIALPRYCNHPVNGTPIAYSATASVTVAALT